MITCIYLTLYLFLPLYLSWRFAQDRTHHFFVWLIQFVFIGSCVLSIYFIVVWPLLINFYLRYLIVIVFVLASCISCRNLIFSWWDVDSSKKLHVKIINYSTWLRILLQIVVTIIFVLQITESIGGRRKPSRAVELDFPLKGGVYCIAQGGNSSLLNHHYHISAQKYALDIIQLNTWGFRSRKLMAKELVDYNIYDANVYSPCDGIVVKCCDGMIDQIPGNTYPEIPAGNYIAIQQAYTNHLVLLAHLKNKSILVHQGERVVKGEHIAQVGNTGNSTEPHLHIHCIAGNAHDLFFTSKGIPITFSERFLSRNDLIFSTSPEQEK